MKKWTATDIPSQAGRSAVVTGTGGLGFEDALELARAGADVILAGRNPMAGREAVDRIRRAVPSARIVFEQLDLADLSSVAEFAQRLGTERKSLDLLINNAGVMTPPTRQETVDGFELQFGTNHLGHFALTAHLMPLLREGRDPRVISLASVAARRGTIRFDDLQSAKSYRPARAYAQSKLACLLFAFELHRRSSAESWGVASIAAHPGIARTDLFHKAPGRTSLTGIASTLFWFLLQPASQGALPTLFAATSPDARPGGYHGPDRFSEARGYPAPSKAPAEALDEAVAARLWSISEELTGAAFPKG